MAFRNKRLMLRSVEPDIEQLRRLRDGDEDVFVMLVARYHQPMLRMARTMVSSEAVAEEIVQDTWMGVVRGIDRFEGRSSFKTWLYRILINRARSAGAKENLTTREIGLILCNNGETTRRVDSTRLRWCPYLNRPSKTWRLVNVRSSSCEMWRVSPTMKCVEHWASRAEISGSFCTEDALACGRSLIPKLRRTERC